MQNNLFFSFIFALICSLILTFSLYFSLKNKRKQINNEEFINNYKKRIFHEQQKPKNKRDEFKYYYNGIPDTYDIYGNKIKGIEPNAYHSIRILNELINEENKDEDRIQLARIYDEGMHKFEPNKEQANIIYNEILNNTPNIEFRNQVNILGQQSTDLELLDINRVLLNAFEEQNENHRNDSQNTHDSGVIASVKNTMKKIDQPTVKDSMHDIKSFILQQPESTKKQDALKSFEDICRKHKNSKVQTGKTIPETLNIVWNRINDNKNKENVDNLKEILYTNLSEIQEHGLTICPTGISNKLIDTLNLIDPDVTIKPKNVLNQEMLTKSAKIREEFIHQLSETDKNLYEKGTHSNQSSMDKKLQDKITNTLVKDYKDLFSEKQVKNIISSWIKYI